MPRNREFSRRLMALVEPLNLTQAQLGKMWGCTQSYAGQILRGDAHPGREQVERIIAAHNLPHEEWVALAGYGPNAYPSEAELIADAVEERVRRLLDGRTVESGADRFMRRIDELESEFPGEVEFLHLAGGFGNLTVERADLLIEDLRSQLLERANRTGSRAGQSS